VKIETIPSSKVDEKGKSETMLQQYVSSRLSSIRLAVLDEIDEENSLYIDSERLRERPCKEERLRERPRSKEVCKSL